MANEENAKTQDIKLDDTRRVRVLSPGMLVAKRFFRNRLAIIGMVIIIFMFLFSFLGGAIIPYGQSQVFYRTEEMKKDYAGATYISDYMLFENKEAELPSDLYSKSILGISTGKNVAETRNGGKIALRPLEGDSYIVYHAEETKNPRAIRSQEHDAAVGASDNYFEYDGVPYIVDSSTGKELLYMVSELGVVCKLSFTPYAQSTVLPFDFYKNVLVAMSQGDKKFEAQGNTYTLEQGGEESAMVLAEDGSDYVYITNMNMNSVIGGVFLSPEFKEAAALAIKEGAESFEYTSQPGEASLPETEGEGAAEDAAMENADAADAKAVETYLLSEKNGQYLISRFQQTRVIDTYAKPSKAHLVGTDANGMDLLARLMYGGRISLLIGFVVVIIEVIIGVIIGGIAGYFGGWIDTVLMRLVDVIYCIPSMPLYLILGSVMDHYRASPTVRIYMLCVVMSIIGWVGIARIVRGQILSLREQEFMVAAEATGVRVSRRIFKHLVPNVVPQLIVFATMGLGEVILAEATLSFLGLGIKYPAASWGCIINAVNDSYVMTNYLFVWVPAGLLILLTVLAFNFIGDGLRDAFDPKMKR